MFTMKLKPAQSYYRFSTKLVVRVTEASVCLQSLRQVKGSGTGLKKELELDQRRSTEAPQSPGVDRDGQKQIRVTRNQTASNGTAAGLRAAEI